METGLAVIHKGETYSGVGNGGGAPSISLIINNNSDTKIQQQGQPQWDGQNLVITLENAINDHIQRNLGPLRGTIMNLRRT